MGVTLTRVKTTIRAAAEAVSDAMRIGYADPSGSYITWPGVGSWPRGLGWKRDRTGTPGWLDILLESLEEEIDPKKLGSCYLSSVISTPMLTPGAWVKVLGTTTAGGLDGFTHSDNRLVYTPAVAKTVMCMASIEVDVSMPATTVSLAFAKNGAVVGASQISRLTVLSFEESNIVINWPIALAQNDYVEVFARTSLAANLTVQQMTFTAFEI